MIKLGNTRSDTYQLIKSEESFESAHEIKEKLRYKGYRVKIVKNSYGIYEIYVKNITLIDKKSHEHRAR